MSSPIKEAKPGFMVGETGFHMEFENGYGLSVQWSRMHYCSLHGSTDPARYQHSYTAECAETTPSGIGKVHTHCPPDMVLKLLRKQERKPTAAEREMARQCRIENLQRKHG